MNHNAPERIIRLSEKQLEILKKLLSLLRKERDAICAFSIDGIVECNNNKESLLLEIEFIEKERSRLIETMEENEREEVQEKLKGMRDKYLSVLRAISVEMERNLGLLCFSIDNMKGLIETIIESINKGFTYPQDKKNRQSISLLLSREV